MNDRESTRQPSTKPIEPKAAEGNVTDPASNPTVAATRATKILSPEEQMELYEKQLKEDDWGHQPC